MRTLTLILAVTLFCSCSQSRQLNKARDTFDKNPGDAALYCAEKFPVQESTRITVTDTVRDTIPVPVYKVVDITCPPSPKDTVIKYKLSFAMPAITTRIRDSVIRTVPDSARVRVLRDSLANAGLIIRTMERNIQETERSLAKARKTLFWFWVAVAILVLFLTRKLWMPLLGGLPSMGFKLFSSVLKLFR
jgi:hypothetical protein